MKVRFYSSITLLVFCMAAMLFGGATSEVPRESAAEFPTGVYTGGSVTITFDEKGVMRATMGEQVLVEARYTVTDDQLSISDETGLAACDDPDQESGTYTWSYDGEALTLILVSDTCQGRIRALTSQPLVRQAQE